MNINAHDFFKLIDLKAEKGRKTYENGEHTDYVLYKLHFQSLRNEFLNEKSVEVLKSAALLRSLKLLVEEENTAPIISYYPRFSAFVLKESSFTESFPTETEDGEHLLDDGERLKLWMKTQVEKGNISVEKDMSIKNKVVSSLLSRSLTVYENPLFSTVKSKSAGHEKPNLLCVDDSMGFLSNAKNASAFILLNSLFFAMETTDMENIHTSFGQPYGLTINEGKTITPPLFRRGAFFVDVNGNCRVDIVSAEKENFFIDEIPFISFENCEIWRRPRHRYTSLTHGDIDVVIVNGKIISWKEGGNTEIPDAGFILRMEKSHFRKLRNFHLSFKNNANMRFAVQGGPILVKEGKIQEGFGDEEFGGETNYPPTVFPFDWDKTPAARIAIGNAGNEILILAVEGCNKTPYLAGVDSRGFTLQEMAVKMKEMGTENALNLDGGGSMQIRLFGGKPLKYADRRGIPFHEFERPVPAMISVK